MLILEEIAKAGGTVEEAAEKMSGNYKRWNNYAFMGTDIPRFETLMLGYLVTHEYTIRQLTNLEAVTQALAPYVGTPQEGALANIYKQSYCGDADMLTGVCVQVYNDDGTITEPFKLIYELAKKLEKADDEIIDEDLFKVVNRRQLLGYVAGELPYICRNNGITFTDDLVTTVVDDLIENDDTTFDSIDTDTIKHSLTEMGLMSDPHDKVHDYSARNAL